AEIGLGHTDDGDLAVQVPRIHGALSSVLLFLKRASSEAGGLGSSDAEQILYRSVELFQISDILFLKRDLRRRHQLLQLADFGDTDDRRRHLGLAQEPGDRDLGRRMAELLGYLDYPLRDLEVHLPAVEAFGPLPVHALGAGGAAGIEAPLVGARQNAARQRRPGSERHAGRCTVGIHLPLFLAVDEVVVVLHRNEARPAVPFGRHLQLTELPGEHRRGTEVECLARLHHVMQRLHRLFDRRTGEAGPSMRMPVDDDLIDVVETESLKAGVDALHDVLARQSALIGVRTHRRRDLRGDHILIARGELAQELANDPFAGTEPVYVGAIEIEEPELQRLLEDRPGFVDRQRPIALMTTTRLAEVHRAETQTRHAQPAITELPRLQHGLPPSPDRLRG